VHNVADLQKRQVGLRMPVFLLNDIDKITKKYKINRTDILIEATKSYLEQVKENEVYQSLGQALAEVRQMTDGKMKEKTARSILDEV
jgi:CopG family transcriptional regulator / antitoxin EndoAI